MRFWMHNGMLNLSDEKMSKSLGNILTLREILDEHRPEALIAVFLASHYRSPMEFSADLLEESRAAGGPAAERLRRTGRPGRRGRRRWAAPPWAPAPSDGRRPRRRAPASALLERLARARQAFADALADDLNTAAALAEVFGLAREANAALAAGELTRGDGGAGAGRDGGDGPRPGAGRRRRR